MENDFTKLLPNQEKLEQRFSFIQDEILRANIVITFRYIIFLINLENHNTLPGPILYSLYKDLILHTATIVESCVQFALQCYIDKGVVSEDVVMGVKWIEESNKLITELDDGNKRVCGIVQVKSYDTFSKQTQFIVLNKAGLRAKLLTNSSFEESEKLRQSRNRIHLAGLTEVDELYTKKDVERHFGYANTVIMRIEKILGEL